MTTPTTSSTVRPGSPQDGPGADEAYPERVALLQERYRTLPAASTVRLAKRTSNLFRSRSRTGVARLDVSGFDGVIGVDRDRRTAQVQGMTTYEHLVDATLAHGLMPLVVPQLKTITLGGAISGLGIEASSFRNGFPHESVSEMDILTGDGRVVTARADNEHRALFHGFPNSYGTLGYLLRATIELEPVDRFVHLRHLRFSTVAELAEVMDGVCSTGVHGAEAVQFVDATVFGPGECYLTLGSWASWAPMLSDYTWTEIYYRSLQRRGEDWLTTRDYLWRWDTDWFWCSRAFGVQRRWVRRLLGRRWLRSDVYWRLVALDERFAAKSTLDRWRGRPAREPVIQDVEVPIGRLAEFVEAFQRNVPIAPIWLCPIRQRDPGADWVLYRLDPDELYVNVGFWSTVPLAEGMDPSHHNRWVEDEVERLDGRKSLYSTSFYDQERFWRLYNGPAYQELKRAYDPEGRLLDLYAKCVQAR
jgi:FAD/FMN-containing dehydrogenase